MPTASPWLPSVSDHAFTLTYEVTTSVYAAIDGSATPSATRANHEIVASRACRLMNLRAHIATFPSSGSGIIAVSVNGVQSDLAVTFSSPVVGGWVANLVDSIYLAAGDKVCLNLNRPLEAEDWEVTAITLQQVTY